MPHKDWNHLNLISLVIVTFFGFWGGFLNFLRRTKTHPEFNWKQKIFHFFVDAVSVSSITIIAYLGLVGYGLNELLSVAISGFIGHQGTRAIYVMEIFLAEKFGGDETVNVIKEEHQNAK